MSNIILYHFILDHRVGGPHIYVDSLRKELANQFVSFVVTTGRGPMTELSLLNLRHIWPPLYAIELVLNVIWVIYFVLVGRIQRREALFNVHGGANLAPLLAARLVGIPVVWHIHETTPSIRRFVDIGRRILRGWRHSIAVVAERAREAYELHPVKFLPAFVDSKFWSRSAVSDAALAACGWPGENDGTKRPFRLLTVGNLNPLKGMDVLLDALSELEGPWHLQIVGAELSTHLAYAQSLRARAAAVMATNKLAMVDFLGWQDKHQVRAMMAGCDVFVLPSRSEACPIALLEAMAMGCRCLVADVGDTKAMLKDCPDTKLFLPESVRDCQIALRELRMLCDSGLSEGKDCTRPAWQMKSVVSATADLYSHLLQSKM